MTSAPLMNEEQFKFIAEEIGPMVGWPSQLQVIADVLVKTNSRFDRDKFIRRATAAWEKKHDFDPIGDNIPY